MILDKSNLNDKDLREFLIEKCSVGYLADYIIKLRNDNKAVKNLTIPVVSEPKGKVCPVCWEPLEDGIVKNMCTNDECPTNLGQTAL
jgi:hypothetical protein